MSLKPTNNTRLGMKNRPILKSSRAQSALKPRKDRQGREIRKGGQHAISFNPRLHRICGTETNTPQQY